VPDHERNQSYEQTCPDTRFSEWLRDRASDSWREFLEHRFVRECSDGSIDSRVYEVYLEQEYAFVETAASAVGYAIGEAPSMQQIRRLTEALDGLVTDQRAYFEETFDALGVEEWRDPNPLQETRHLSDIVLRAATGDGYAESLAPMLAAEWAYATWCERAVAEGSFDRGSPVGYWITLHRGDSFRNHVEWLRDELDRIGPGLSTSRQRDVEYLFRRTLDLEASFHAAPYDVVE
jgi:thiaminase/transcriptional activator TenA